MNEKIEHNDTAPTPWEKERDRIKTLWVVSVLVFWGSIAFQVVLYFIQGKISFILISIIIGMMILGVALKIRLQRHLRSKPDNPE